MAASNWTRNDIGVTRRRGACSTRNMATPRLTGTAISSAMTEETAVPYIKGSAPNCSATGSHRSPHRNDAPNFSKVSVELLAISIIIKTTSPAMVSANRNVACLNSQSAGLSDPRSQDNGESRRAFGGAAGGVVSIGFIEPCAGEPCRPV